MTTFNENVIVSYQGPFLQKNIEEIGKVLRTNLKALGMDFSVQQAIFSVAIELSHNILRYSSKSHVGSLKICLEDDYFTIVSKNPVTEEQKKELIRRLEWLGQLNKLQLRQAYIEQRRKEETADSLSIGLGLIEIAKRSSGPLNYSFERKGSIEMFQMNVQIGGKLKCID